MSFMRRRLAVVMAAGLVALLASYTLGEHMGAAVSRPATVITRAPVTQKVVALTFDDGPTPKWTPQILAVLNAAHVKATFFVIGSQARKYSQLVAREVKDGMEIGSHGALHKRLVNQSATFVRSEVETAATDIMAAGAPRPRLYRMPAGVYDATALQVLGQLGYRVIGWSVDPQDWRHRWTAEQMLTIVKRQVGPGSIIIFHDGTNGSRATVEAAKMVIETLKREGYRFVTVSQLLALVRGRI